jgi:two-component system sensor histidine kinase BaeS
MIPIGKSILIKLWIAFLATLALAVSATLFFTHWNMQKGFVDYVNEKSVKQLGSLEYVLVRVHNEHGSWNILRHKKGLWRELRHRALLSHADHHDHPANKHYLKNFFEPLVLVDEDRQLVAGHPRGKAHYRWHPIQDEEKILGYIGYIKPHRLIRTVDQLFLERQLRSFWLVGALCLVLSSVLAWLLSRRFVRPIKKLSAGAQALASGNYKVRIDPDTNDELGRLCHHFNELASALAANEHSRRQWVADISHEMRTPLAVVKAQIEALQDGIREPSAENLALVHNKVNALSRLIDDLYELSLSDLGALRYHKQPLPLAAILREAIEGYEARFSQAQLQLQLQFQVKGSDLVYGDGERLIQLFHNLLENSLRYTQAPGTVRVQAQRHQQRFVVVVEDSAPGVDTEQLDRIFDRLYRLETSRNRETGGAGLGLSICKNIVTAHQGQIKASQSPLGGLRITIHFPVYEHE